VTGALKWVAVAGCGRHRWIREISAVILISVATWQWQYWLRYGGLKKGWGKERKNGVCHGSGDCLPKQRVGEWQWLVAVGTVGKRRSRRFEWYRLESGGVKID
jgi:hypothetical protein